MGAIPAVLMEFKANAKEALSSIGEVHDKLGTLADKGKLTGEALQKHIGQGAIAVGGALTAAGAVAEELGSKLEQAQAQMEVAFKNAGSSVEAFRQPIAATVGHMEKFGHTAADTDAALTKMTAATNSPAKALSMMGLAADLAARQHISLADAADMVDRVIAGKGARTLALFGINTASAAQQTKGLAGEQKKLDAANNQAAASYDALAKAQQRLGDLEAIDRTKKKLTVQDEIALRTARDAVTAASDKYNAAQKAVEDGAARLHASQGKHLSQLDELSAKLHGSAAAAAGTFHGRLEALRAKVEDVVAGFGKKFGPALVTIGPVLAGVGGIISAGVIPAVVGLVTAAAPFLLIAAAVAAIGLAFYEAYQHIPAFREAVQAVVGFITGTIWPAIKEFASNLIGAFRDAWGFVSGAFTAFVDFIKQWWPVLLAVILGPLGILIDLIIKNWSTVWEVVKTVWNAFREFITVAFQVFAAIVKPLWEAVTLVVRVAWDLLFGPSGILTVTWHILRAIIEGEWKAWSAVIGALWGAITGAVSAVWSALFGDKGIILVAWRLIKGIIEGEWNTWTSIVTTIWGTVTGGISTAWNAVFGDKGVLAGAWNGFKGFIVGGINDVIKVINGFIDLLDKIPGVHIGKLGLIDTGPSSAGMFAGAGGTAGHTGGTQMARGGTVGSGFVTDGPRAIVGEGNPSWPEFVIPTDPAYRDRAVGLFNQLGGRLMAGGGLLGDLNPINIAKGALDTAKSVVGGIVGAALGPAKAAADAAASHLPSPFDGIARSVIDQVAGAAQSMFASSGSGSGQKGGLAAAPGQVGGWIAQALAIIDSAGIGLNLGPDLIPGISNLIMHESGGDPGAVNRTDSNWLAGHPSMGLMQTIQSTFDAYALPGHGNILNPVDNIIAGTRYALANYGLGMLAAGGRHDAAGNYIGYAAGGTLPFGTYDAGGYLPPGLSLAYNGLGAPEPVGASGGGDLHVHIDGGTFFGSNMESAAEDLRRELVKIGKRNGSGSIWGGY